MTLPAVLGAPPAFPDGLAFSRPLTPPFDDVMARLKPSYDSGMLTNGPLLHELEEQLATTLGVDHVVAVSSCTAGLMLTLQALRLRGGVVLPSFTFSATAHAAAWNGLTPIFAECDRWTLQLDPIDAGERLAQHGGVAIVATHVFGAPAPIEALTDVAASHRVPLVFDAAHGLGMLHKGRPVGRYGVAEIFSMSPTKLVAAGEGGVVATNDASLAATVRMGREYGNGGDYDTRFAGLNARLSEFHAATALCALALLDEHVATRRALAARYIDGLADVAGIRAPSVSDDDVANYKDFTLIFDAAFGLDRDTVAAALLADGIHTRPYFHPPVHRHRAYAHLPSVDLPITDAIASSVLSLPMHALLSNADVDRVVGVVRALGERADEISALALAQQAT
jgi:dTDP-4-amino-4,6-dideoxygalactose transaminase